MYRVLQPKELSQYVAKVTHTNLKHIYQSTCTHMQQCIHTHTNTNVYVLFCVHIYTYMHVCIAKGKLCYGFRNACGLKYCSWPCEADAVAGYWLLLTLTSRSTWPEALICNIIANCRYFKLWQRLFTHTYFCIRTCLCVYVCSVNSFPLNWHWQEFEAEL